MKVIIAAALFVMGMVLMFMAQATRDPVTACIGLSNLIAAWSLVIIWVVKD